MVYLLATCWQAVIRACVTMAMTFQVGRPTPTQRQVQAPFINLLSAPAVNVPGVVLSFCGFTRGSTR